METGVTRSIGSELTAEEQDALASQVLELIGGLISGAAQTTEEPGDRDVWSLEEGDDSVFYSDEEETHQDAALSQSRAKVCQRLTNSVADDETEEVFTSDIKRETTQQVICAKDIQQKLKIAETEERIILGEERTEAAVPAEQFEKSCGEVLQPNSTAAHNEKPTGKNTAAEKVNKGKEEEVARKAQTPDHHSVHLEGPKQLSDADPPLSTSRQLAEDQGAERPHAFQGRAALQRNQGSGYSPLALGEVPELGGDHQDPFSRVSYSTVSCIRICRGNTRLRIEHFEQFMKNQ